METTTTWTLLAMLTLLPACVVSAYRDHAGQSEMSAYCQSENFHGKCQDDEVIVMTSAKYGRMRIDRCVTADFGYVGCSRDVMDAMDWRCSGRVTCDVQVLDKSFPDVRSCHGDLKSYLEVRYSCVKALKGNANASSSSSCGASDEPVKVTNDSGFISGGSLPVGVEDPAAEQRGCLGGSSKRETTWLVLARPGQRVNVTLHDFTLPGRNPNALAPPPPHTSSRDVSSTTSCKILATIREDPPGRGSVTVCSGEGRLRNVYLSIGHKVEIKIWNTKPGANSAAFLLHYEAIGCVDLPAPPGAWIKRESEVSLMVGCSHTSQKWMLVCNGTKWAGTWQNCSTAPMAANGSGGEVSLGFIPLPMKVSIVIIVGLALAIGLLVLATGLICLRRLPRHSRRGTPDGCRVTYGEHQPVESIYPKATIVYRMRDTQTATSLQYPTPAHAQLPDYNNTKNLYSSMNRQQSSGGSSSCCRPSAAAADDPDLCSCNIQQPASPGHVAQPPDLMRHGSSSYHALDPVDYYELDRRALHFEPEQQPPNNNVISLSNEGTLDRSEACSTTSTWPWGHNNIPKSNPKRHVSITAHYTTNIFDDRVDGGDANLNVSLQNQAGDATV